jgi:hypothetical protein
MSGARVIDHRAEFAKTLALLATLANVTLTAEVMELYFTELSDHPAEDVIRIMREYARATNPRTGLPTIDAISEKIRPKLSAKDYASEISFKAIEAISKHGWCNGDRAREELGDLGWEVVRRMGGWNNLCEQSDHTPLSILEAKTREIARIVVAQSQGAEFERPRLASSEVSKGIGEVIRFLSEGKPFEKPEEPK